MAKEKKENKGRDNPEITEEERSILRNWQRRLNRFFKKIKATQDKIFTAEQRGEITPKQANEQKDKLVEELFSKISEEGQTLLDLEKTWEQRTKQSETRKRQK